MYFTDYHKFIEEVRAQHDRLVAVYEMGLENEISETERETLRKAIQALESVMGKIDIWDITGLDM